MDQDLKEKLLKNACCSNSGGNCRGRNPEQPLYVCKQCRVPVCAACAMVGHVENNHECVSVDNIRKEFAEKISPTLLVLNKFRDGDWPAMNSDMIYFEKILNEHLNVLGKLRQDTSSLKVCIERDLNKFSGSVEYTSVQGLYEDTSTMEDYKKKAECFTKKWDDLKERMLSVSWNLAEKRPDTPVFLPCPRQDVHRPNTPPTSSTTKKVGDGSSSNIQLPVAVKAEEDSKTILISRKRVMAATTTLNDPQFMDNVLTSSDTEIHPGDVVWARNNSKSSFWPALILEPKNVGIPDDNSGKNCVYWFGWSRITPKVMCNVVPFEKNFEKNYNPKRKGVYFDVGLLDALKYVMKRKGYIIDENIDEDTVLSWAKNGFREEEGGTKTCSLPDYVKDVIKVYMKTVEKEETIVGRVNSGSKRRKKS